MRHVARHKIGSGVHQIGDERDVAGKPVELGDDERGLVTAAGIEGERELGAVVLGAALDFGELRRRCSARVRGQSKNSQSTAA